MTRMTTEPNRTEAGSGRRAQSCQNGGTTVMPHAGRGQPGVRAGKARARWHLCGGSPVGAVCTSGVFKICTCAPVASWTEVSYGPST